MICIKKVLNFNTLTLSDVAGCDEAKIEIVELVLSLKNPDYCSKLGAKTFKVI